MKKTGAAAQGEEKTGARWYVYILRCADGTLYTGSTTDPDRRLNMHNAGRGAKYTRARRPCVRVYCEEAESKSAALRREASVKRLSRAQKLALIAAQQKAGQSGAAPRG